MTVATDIAIASAGRRQPWRVLLWLAPLTAFWIGLNYWLPGLQASGVPSTASRLAIHIAIVLGLWLALERTGLTQRRRLGVWLAVVVPYTLWLAVIWSAAVNGVFRPGNNILPLVPLGALALPVQQAAGRQCQRGEHDRCQAHPEFPATTLLSSLEPLALAQ